MFQHSVKRLLFIILGGILFLGIVPPLAFANPRQPEMQCCHSATVPVSASVWQSSVPDITISNNRPQMLVFLRDFHDQSFNVLRLTDEFPTQTAYWSNLFFGETGETVNAFFSEMSGEFDFQFIPPRFIDANGAGIDRLFLENPAPGICWILIQDGVVHARQTAPSGDLEGSINAAHVFSAIRNFIDLSALPRHIDFWGRPAIFVDDFQIYTIIAGGTQAVATTPSSFTRDGRIHTPTLSYINGWEVQANAWQGEFVARDIFAAAHEIGHLFGLPDLYGSPFGGGWGNIGAYSLMATSRAHLDPWSKMMLGFVEPQIITVEPNMNCIILNVHSIGADEPYNVVKVRSPVSQNQYFLIENRQHIGFDKGLALQEGFPETHTGILIWQIDESILSTFLPGNPNTNWMHRGVTPVGIGQYTWGYNPFFRADGRNLFSLDTIPNSDFHTEGNIHPILFSPPTEICCPRIVQSGIEIEVLSNSGHTMQVRISYSDGISQPPIPATGVNIAGAAVRDMLIGQQQSLTANVMPNDATNQDVTWNSDAPSVATVSTSGEITAVSAGAATITATTADGGFTASVTVNVTAPPPNTTALETLITQAEALAPYENNYTADSWSMLQSALQNAQIILDNATEQDVIDGAYTMLRTALENLVPAPNLDTTDLEALLVEIDSMNLNADDFIESRWLLFEDALHNAETALANATEQERIDTAYEALQAAFDALFADYDEPGDPAKLEELLAYIEGLNLNEDNFTEESWAIFQSVLNLAQTILENTFTQEMIDSTYDMLRLALERLDPVVNLNTTALETLIDNVQARNEQGYTRTSWMAVVAALRNAEAVLEHANDQDSIDAAYALLRSAVNALERFANPFIDVSGVNWFYEHVMFVARNELMTGTSDTIFAPGMTMTRAQMVQVLYNAQDQPDIDFAPVFSDVAQGRWYADAVIWAAENEIVAGIGGGRFAPERQISRQEMAMMLRNYMAFLGYGIDAPDAANVDGFYDYGEISDWAYETMRWAVYHGIMQGYSNRLTPLGTATRAECAAMLRNFIDRFEFGR